MQTRIILGKPFYSLEKLLELNAPYISYPSRGFFSPITPYRHKVYLDNRRKDGKPLRTAVDVQYLAYVQTAVESIIGERWNNY